MLATKENAVLKNMIAQEYWSRPVYTGSHAQIKDRFENFFSTTNGPTQIMPRAFTNRNVDEGNAVGGTQW